jgi:hypothetical protein
MGFFLWWKQTKGLKGPKGPLRSKEEQKESVRKEFG